MGAHFGGKGSLERPPPCWSAVGQLDPVQAPPPSEGIVGPRKPRPSSGPLCLLPAGGSEEGPQDALLPQETPTCGACLTVRRAPLFPTLPGRTPWPLTHRGDVASQEKGLPTLGCYLGPQGSLFWEAWLHARGCWPCRVGLRGGRQRRGQATGAPGLVWRVPPQVLRPRQWVLPPTTSTPLRGGPFPPWKVEQPLLLCTQG